jgi:hypothetical protein
MAQWKFQRINKIGVKMNLLTKVKRFVLDRRQIPPELYRPLMYWLYIFHPLNKTGEVNFPSLENMAPILNKLQIDIKNFHLNRSELEGYMSRNISEYWHYFSTGYGKAFVGKTAEHFVCLKISNFRGGGIH